MEKAVANGEVAKLTLPTCGHTSSVHSRLMRPPVLGSATPPAANVPSPAMIVNEKLKDAEFVFDVDDAGVKICYCKIGGRTFEGRGE